VRDVGRHWIAPPPGQRSDDVVLVIASHKANATRQGLNWLEEQPFPFVVYTKHAGDPPGTPYNIIPASHV
jgi:hypothetical protein